MITSTKKPWADEPFPLIPIHTLTSLNADILYIAKEMANAHNNLTRSLNSIYNQAPYVKEAGDLKDLLQYATFWTNWIEHHHHSEEATLFPGIEHATSREGWMSANIEQHKGLNKGVVEFSAYIKKCIAGPLPESFNAVEFQRIIDSFGGVFSAHLSDEITTLLELESSTLEQIKEIKKAFELFDGKMREGEKSIIFPMVLGTSDADFHGEPLWPPVPGPVRYVVQYVFARKYRSVWRFSPSDLWGNKRDLAFGLEA